MALLGSGNSRVVGRIATIWRYPVKSMAGEALQSADVWWHGLNGDRRWAFIRNTAVRNGFPWLTIRQRPELLLHRPYFVNPDDPNDSDTIVRTPNEQEWDVADPKLAAQFGDGIRVIRQYRGVFDGMPLSLISTGSIATLAGLTGMTLDPRRFRPNLLVETDTGEPFPEDAWVGHELQIGQIRMRVDRRDPRCAIVNIDPDTADRSPEILRTIAARREMLLGVYGSVVQLGTVGVGDPVILAADGA